MKRSLFFIGIALSFAAVYAHAQTKNPFASIKFPIAELGGCTDVASCKAYCDIDANESACIVYGKAHGLIPQNVPTQTASTTQQKLQRLVQDGSGPGGCSSLSACQTYCSDSTHRDECVAFAQKNNLLSKSQKDEVNKTQKLQTLISSGKGPGGCSSVSECKTYCSDSTHRDECVAFAKTAGVITSTDAERIQQIPTAGPGGCDSPEACAAFCNNSANVDTCISFAKDHGILKPGEDTQIRDGISASREVLQAPLEARNCFPKGIEAQLESGNIPPAEALNKIRVCFEQFKQNASSTAGGMNMPPRQDGRPPQGTFSSTSGQYRDAQGRVFIKPVASTTDGRPPMPGTALPPKPTLPGTTNTQDSADMPPPAGTSNTATVPPPLPPPPKPQTFPTSPSGIGPTILNLLSLPSMAASAALSGAQNVYSFFFKF